MNHSKQIHKLILFSILILSILLLGVSPCLRAQEVKEKTAVSQTIKLPQPVLKSNFSLEQALAERRSIRSYTDDPLTLSEISQLLWAAQGVTDTKTGHRTAPSAMAKYPLELYVVAANVKGLASGLYHYQPTEHNLVLVKPGDVRTDLSTQPTVKTAPAVFLFTGVYERIGTRFGDRSKMFVFLEAGHAAQNLCLQATALHLGTVTVGGIDPVSLKKAVSLPENEDALYVLPVGKPKI
jgi:SagB-type dehydrogenase family enzyme